MTARTSFTICLAIAAIPVCAVALGLYQFVALRASNVDAAPLADVCVIAYRRSVDATGHVGIAIAVVLLVFLLVRSVAAFWRGWRETRDIRGLSSISTDSPKWRVVEAFADTYLPRNRIQLVAADEPMAVTVGYIWPRVLLSSGLLALLDGPELEAVLHHERAHVRRRDPLRTLISDCCQTALPFIPLIGYIARQFRIGEEIEADAAAIAALGTATPLASALAKVLTAMPVRPAGVGLTPTEARIDSLLGREYPREPKAKFYLAAAFSVPALGILSLGLYILASSPHITTLHICPS